MKNIQYKYLKNSQYSLVYPKQLFAMYSKLFLLILFYSIITIASSEKARYDFYRMYRILPSSENDIKILKEIQNRSDSYKFIKDPIKINEEVLIILAPHKLAEFTDRMESEEISYELIDENFQKHIDAEANVLTRAKSDFGWESYYELDVINKWLDSMARKFPNQTEIVIGGKSYEGREIKGVKLSYKENNPGVFIEGGIHAREWISPATVTYIMNQLLTSSDKNIRYIAENVDWYFFPSINPDGYTYTHEKDRLWRKTRQPYNNCFGADPNRNWDFHWRDKGSSDEPCSEIFAGSKPFSEPESASLSNYLTSLKGKLQTYLAFHSYSQILLFPYGHSAEHVDNFDDLQEIGEKTAQSLRNRYGTEYRVGNIYDAIYPASGGSMDWAFGTLDIPIAFTYELRPGPYSNRGGFVLPPEQIIPNCEEVMDSVVTLIMESERLGYFDNFRLT